MTSAKRSKSVMSSAKSDVVCDLLFVIWDFSNGGVSFDTRTTPYVQAELSQLLKLRENLSADSIVARAKSIVSPYFTANDFVFAYARA